MVQILHGHTYMKKKIFIVELRFKLSWPSCIFICSIWPPWMGHPSTPVGEGREVTSGKEPGLFAWCLVSGTPGRPGLWLQACLPGPLPLTQLPLLGTGSPSSSAHPSSPHSLSPCKQPVPTSLHSPQAFTSCGLRAYHPLPCMF